MTYVFYAALAVLVMAAVWTMTRFIRETRAISRYVRRTKATGHVKSEIRRHRRAIAKRSPKAEAKDPDRA